MLHISKHKLIVVDWHVLELSNSKLLLIRAKLKKKMRELVRRLIQYLMEDINKALSITANLSYTKTMYIWIVPMRSVKHILKCKYTNSNSRKHWLYYFLNSNK